MTSRLRFLTLGILLLAPASAFAMQQTVWDFRDSKVQVDWQVSGFDKATPTAAGLHIVATRGGGMLTKLALPHPTEVISMIIASAKGAEGQLMWHRRGDPQGVLVQLPFSVTPGGEPQIINMNVDAYPQWDRYADQIAITLQPGADVMLVGMQMTHWNVFEKTAEAWKSFWTFDTFGPFSINFVWGPILTFNPVGTAELFVSQPPRGRSALLFFYIVIVIVAAATFGIGKLRKKNWSIAAILACCVLGAWAVLDLRMGAELLRYTMHDQATYIAAEPNEKTFRTYLDFNECINNALSFLKPGETVAILTSDQTPVSAMARYFAYPALAVNATKPMPDAKAWFVFHRSDVKVNDDGVLSVGGNAWTKPGTIVSPCGGSSFLFRVNP